MLSHFLLIGSWVSSPQSFKTFSNLISKLIRRYIQSRGLHTDPPASVSGALHFLPYSFYFTFLQTWLASYFVVIDLFLVTQYFYYYKPPKHSLSALSRIRSASSPRIDRSASRYRTLSVVASNVAAAAAVAAQQDSHRPPSARYSQQSDQHRLYERSSSGASRRFADADPGYDDEEDPPVMADSYHSDGGRETNRKRVSWSPERHRSRAASVGKTPAILHLPDRNVDSHERPSNETPVVSRRGSRASRRGSTMVFLGAWALFGIGTLASGRTGMAITTNDTGRVLVSGHTPIYSSLFDLSKLSFNELDTFHTRNESPSNEQILGRIFAWLCTTLYLTSRLPQIWKNVSHNKLLKCLFFSDTLSKVCQKISRGMPFFFFHILPHPYLYIIQCQGLSMYLFVFAFLGNVFYVASILSSPKNFLPPPQSTQFIRESIP